MALYKVTLPDQVLKQLGKIADKRMVPKRVVLTDLIREAYEKLYPTNAKPSSEFLTASARQMAEAGMVKPGPKGREDLRWWLTPPLWPAGHSTSPAKFKTPYVDFDGTILPANPDSRALGAIQYPSGYPDELRGRDHMAIASHYRKTGEVDLDQGTPMDQWPPSTMFPKSAAAQGVGPEFHPTTLPQIEVPPEVEEAENAAFDALFGFTPE